MSDIPTNFQVLRRSRKKPVAGDVFAMLMCDGRYLFGRVIGADLEDWHETPMPGAYLIYVYQYRSDVPEPDLTELVPDNLLIAPVFINKMPWNRGYFENVAHQDLAPADLLAQPCFWDPVHKSYVDGRRSKLAKKVEPCGKWSLVSYRWLDDAISDALGIPQVPQDS